MPRQIIDTESSRPAYVRRNLLIAFVVIVIVAVALYLAFRAFAPAHVAAAGNPFAIAGAVAVPGTPLAMLKPATRT